MTEEFLSLALSQLPAGLPPPTTVKLNKWRYSQVVKPVAGTPGALALRPDPTTSATVSPLLILAGDAFAASNFDGCFHSARTTVDMLLSARKA